MPISRLFLLLAFFSLSLSITAQTKLLHHRSHSGSLATFDASSPGNFGLPFNYEIIQVIWHSDSMVVEVAQFGPQEKCDTFYFHPVYLEQSISLDSIKRMMGPEVEFIDFEKRSRPHSEALKVQPAQQPKQQGQKNQQGALFLLALGIALIGGRYWWIANRQLGKSIQ